MNTDDLIASAYEMVASGDHWDDLISSFANMVGGASGVIYLRSRHCSGVGILGSAGANFGATLPTYLAYYERRSPLLAFYRNRPEGRVSALGQIAFSRAYRETEYFLDWVRPQGYGDMIGGHLVQRPDLYSWLCIRRPDQHGPYTAAEVRSAKRIAPHLGRAIRLRARIEAQRGVDRGIRAALENMASGILIVDRCGKVLSANKAAESLLRTNEGLLYSRGNIVCERQQENATLQDAIRAAAQPISLGRSPAAEFPVSRRNGRRPLTVHIVPLSSVPAWSGFAPSSGVAVVFLVDPEFESQRGIEAVAVAYGLTASERQVLREIFRCAGLVEAAASLGVAVTTARTHLQGIFSKTDTENQAQLVRLVMRSSLP